MSLHTQCECSNCKASPQTKLFNWQKNRKFETEMFFFVVNRFDLCFRCFRLYLMFCFFFAVGATTLVPANIFLNVRVCEKLINAVVLMRFLLKKRSAKAGSLVSCRTDALLCVLPIELAGLTQGRRRARLRPNALPQPRG